MPNKLYPDQNPLHPSNYGLLAEKTVSLHTWYLSLELLGGGFRPIVLAFDICMDQKNFTFKIII